MRGAPLALGLLLLAAVCGTPLANGKPAKGREVRQSDQAFSVTLVTLSTEYLRAYACSCSVMVAPLFLKFYRNIL